MSKKLVFALTTIMLATIGLSAAEIPNLVGNWTGSYEGYTNGGVYKATNETGAITLPHPAGSLNFVKHFYAAMIS
jgi:hypothetical protein